MSSLLVFIYWRYSQSCWYFRPHLWTSVPLTQNWFTYPPPPPLLPCVNKYKGMYYVYIQCIMGGSGCVESIYMSYTLCIWPDSEPTKLLNHPTQKPRRGGGLRQINTCRHVPLLVNFFLKPTLRVWCLYRYLVHAFNSHSHAPVSKESIL